VGGLIDLGGGLGATVTHHAVLGVGVDSRLAERARALVDGAGGVDEPVGGGALVSCPGDALGRSPVGFPGEYRDLLIEVVRLLELAAGPVQRAGYRAAERVQPVGLGRAVEGVDGDDQGVGQDANHGEGEADDDRGAAGAGPEGVDANAIPESAASFSPPTGGGNGMWSRRAAW